MLSGLVQLAKWPVAFLVALMTPAGAVLFLGLLKQAWAADTLFSPFGMGFCGATALWFLVGRTRLARFWSTMEHEFTHAIFAWLTLVPVIELRSTDGTLQSEDHSQGHVRLGGSNWLISISPYFFPTVPAALMVATWALAAQPSVLARGLLGGGTAYTIFSTWRETHRHQVDLRRVGFSFALLLLPGANLLCFGMLLANELDGPGGAWAHATGAFGMTLGWMRQWAG